ncbi:hypothetical protein EK21DRAFT_78221 [Setomelanomma holmii]|uniref:Lupus La protein n=1 Tax=Setomelanomma holmii TaxID=210430 RepID=A0A9P4GZ62_9PLEO|nr:hypothetical protein EK21DRAFT_78221 [Setomelanomma holmii]
MADTENAAGAATNPAEVSKTESADVKSETKTTETTEKADDKTNGDSESKSKTEDTGEETFKVNGKSSEREERRGGRNERNNERNGRDHNDRRGGGRGRGRGRGRGNFQNNRRRNEEFDNLPETDDPVEIRNQVEFYFSTQNLVTDEHLFHELGGPENRPVSIKHIADFKRMRRFRPYSAVVAALRESKDLIVVDDSDYNGPGKEAVKRKEPIEVPTDEKDEERKPSITDLFYRLKRTSSNKLETSVYAKDFGNEEDAGQIALEAFFRPYGSVMVRKRRNESGAWKGSVFVEFDNEDSQKQFLALDPKPKFNDNELTIMSKREYIVKKCEEKGIEPDFENSKHESNGHRSRGGDRDREGGRGRGRGRGRGGRGGRGGGDRRDRDNNRSRRDDRSPRRRRDRSASGESVDSRDWNTRRDRFNKGKDDRGSRKEEPKDVERDGHGVPVVKDTRTDAEIGAASKKRKADDEDRGESPKKGKLEIKQDE